MIKLLFYLQLIFLSSCYTIHFTKNEKLSSSLSYEISQWHHIGLLGFVEFSDPVNLKNICQKDSWEAVRVRTGFLQGLVRAISYPISAFTVGGIAREEEAIKVPVPVPVTISVGHFYSPEEVSISCKK